MDQLWSEAHVEYDITYTIQNGITFTPPAK